MSVTPRMENQMENSMEDELEIVVLQGFYRGSFAIVTAL